MRGTRTRCSTPIARHSCPAVITCSHESFFIIIISSASHLLLFFVHRLLSQCGAVVELQFFFGVLAITERCNQAATHPLNIECVCLCERERRVRTSPPWCDPPLQFKTSYFFLVLLGQPSNVTQPCCYRQITVCLSVIRKDWEIVYT